MTLSRFSKPLLSMLACCGFASTITGCQTTVGGQTLPSAYYLRDDVQYFPAGPEFILSNTVEAIEQYKLDQSGFQGNFADDGSVAPPAPGGF
ncbi:hypothetical protein GC176_15735 [bacterium]|nr:hypothetical protein [bacterium]